MIISEKNAFDFFNGTMEIIKEQDTLKEIYKSSLTQSGIISRNPQLNGFIAEKWHECTFNFNAEAAGSVFRSKEPNIAHGFAKNSMDRGIYDSTTGKLAGRYQFKYGKTPEHTLLYKQHGNYRGQKILVPEGQENYINGSVNRMTAPDGITSEPISKAKAVELQDHLQNGSYGKYRAAEFIKGASAEIGKGALIGAAIGVTSETIASYQSYKSGNLSREEYVKEIIKAGAATAVTGAVTKGIMILLTNVVISVAGIAVASSPIMIPVTFAVGAAVDKVIAPMFGRGEYKKLLLEAEYYCDIADMYTDLRYALEVSAQQFEAFVIDCQNQLETYERLTLENDELKAAHQRANAYIAELQSDNRQKLGNLLDLNEII